MNNDTSKYIFAKYNTHASFLKQNTNKAGKPLSQFSTITRGDITAHTLTAQSDCSHYYQDPFSLLVCFLELMT